MFPLAIACGNTFVMKPSEKDPSCSVRLAELLHEAGLPPGVMNVVHGDKQAVDALLHDSRVRAVSFVGSTPVAEYVYRQASEQGIRVQSLGGAKNHMVVLPDADIEQAADALIGAAYGSAGERCMAISVAVAVGDAGDRLRDALIPRIAAIKTGPGDRPDVDMGPLVTREHLERVTSYIEKGQAEGADLVVDGRDVKESDWGQGFFLGPSLFDHAGTDMQIYRDEIFGPVLTMLRASNLDQALANVGVLDGRPTAALGAPRVETVQRPDAARDGPLLLIHAVSQVIAVGDTMGISQDQRWSIIGLCFNKRFQCMLILGS